MTRTAVAVALIFILTFAAMPAMGQAKQAAKAKDPVCGIMVEKDPKLSTSYKGETYYFCSKADMDKFKKEPEKYVKKK